MSQEKIERWNEVDGNLDNGEKLQAFLDSTTDAYAILQLRRTDETVYERFESYEALKRQEKEPNIYCVFQSLWLQLGLLVGIGLAVYAVLFLFVLFQEIGEHIKENLRDFIFS